MVSYTEITIEEQERNLHLSCMLMDGRESA